MQVGTGKRSPFKLLLKYRFKTMHLKSVLSSGHLGLKPYSLGGYFACKENEIRPGDGARSGLVASINSILGLFELLDNRLETSWQGTGPKKIKKRKVKSWY